MDLSFLQNIVLFITILIFNIELLECGTKKVSQTAKATNKPAISRFVTRMTMLRSSTKKKKIAMKKTKELLVTEFSLQQLLTFGISSNEANMFIRSRQLKGKPLELQYEKVREADMLQIEKKILNETKQGMELLTLVKLNKERNGKRKQKT